MSDFANRRGFCANRTGKLQIATCFLQIEKPWKCPRLIKVENLQIEHENLQIDSHLKRGI
ncbi:hypothetical protein CHI10_05570 [Bacillus sp. 7894-2]|nr:hypothetical protein CHI10_05570 [Bacillus sp. 7894-2]